MPLSLLPLRSPDSPASSATSRAGTPPGTGSGRPSPAEVPAQRRGKGEAVRGKGQGGREKRETVENGEDRQEREMGKRDEGRRKRGKWWKRRESGKSEPMATKDHTDPTASQLQPKLEGRAPARPSDSRDLSGASPSRKTVAAREDSDLQQYSEIRSSASAADCLRGL